MAFENSTCRRNDTAATKAVMRTMITKWVVVFCLLFVVPIVAIFRRQPLLYDPTGGPICILEGSSSQSFSRLESSSMSSSNSSKFIHGNTLP